MKIYIAGPISGTNDYSERFYEAAAGILNKDVSFLVNYE